MHSFPQWLLYEKKAYQKVDITKKVVYTSLIWCHPEDTTHQNRKPIKKRTRMRVALTPSALKRAPKIPNTPFINASKLPRRKTSQGFPSTIINSRNHQTDLAKRHLCFRRVRVAYPSQYDRNGKATKSHTKANPQRIKVNLACTAINPSCHTQNRHSHESQKHRKTPK